MPKPKRFPAPSYTPPKSSIPKKDYTPSINPHPKKPPKPDLNFGRQNPAKRMAQQQRYNSSPQTQANAYPLGGSNSQMLEREMNTMQVSTRLVDDYTMQSSVIDKIDEGFKAWCKIQAEQTELERAREVTQRIVAETDKVNSERYHQRFVFSLAAAAVIAWIVGSIFKVFGNPFIHSHTCIFKMV
ncbi:hypothetical protein DL95DRAFT_446794 [Leptodontidium sp. 2 PMI_412]|nr:hypothetical protein DL95DRAFT_446794 [Leptodontidium sp. 2 PMI_412]